jgi:hypothetical protein
MTGPENPKEAISASHVFCGILLLLDHKLQSASQTIGV